MEEDASGNRSRVVDTGKEGETGVSPESSVGEGVEGMVDNADSGKGMGVVGYVHFSVLAFGLAAISTSLGQIILPLRVLDVAPESLKNTYLGILTFIGMGVAMLVQPAVGYLSDKTTWRWGRRRPYIAVGALLATGLMVGVGAAANYVSLLVTSVLVQLFANVSQTPYDAMLKDQVPRNQRGKISSVRAMSGAAGAVLLVLATGFIMDHHIQGTRDLWLWIAVALPTAVLAITAVWTLALVRDDRAPSEQPEEREELGVEPVVVDGSADSLALPVEGKKKRSLVAGLGVITKRNLTMLSAAFSYTLAGGILMAYTLYFLKDVVGLENPASGVSVLSASVGATIIVTLWPAGVLTDRLGRAPLLYVSSALGGAGTLMFFLAQNLVHGVLIGIVLGVAVGLFMSAGRALITDMVSENRAALQMGMANFALVGGLAAARLGGPLVDFLNGISENSGYYVMLVLCAVAFCMGAFFIHRMMRGVGRRGPSLDGPPPLA